MFRYTTGYASPHMHPHYGDVSNNDMKAGEVEITFKIRNKNVSSNLIWKELKNMRIVAHNNSYIGSWKELDMLKEFKYHNKYCLDDFEYENKDYAVTRPYVYSDGTHHPSLKIYQHITSKRWWVYLVNCNYMYENAPIPTDIVYKLHWTQYFSYDHLQLVNNEELSSADSSSEHGQPTFRVITFVISWLLLLIQSTWLYCFYVNKRSKIAIADTMRPNEINIQNLQTQLTQINVESELEVINIDTNYDNKPLIASERNIMFAVTLILMFFAFQDLFMITFWLKLMNDGYRIFELYLCGIICQSIVAMLFCWLFFKLFSVQNNKIFTFIQYIFGLLIAIFELVSNIHWYYHYDLGKEHNIYRYDYNNYFHVYGWTILCCGIVSEMFVFHKYNCYCCSKQAIIATILVVGWFIWPLVMLLINYCNPINIFENFTWWNYKQDFITDVVSWSIRFITIFVLLVSLHPLNRYKLHLQKKCQNVDEIQNKEGN